MHTDSAAGPAAHLVPGVRPPEVREFTLRAVLCAVAVAVVIGASYPYVVMKLGFGPNISVVSAFFGYIALGLVLRVRGYNRWENNIVQTAGTSAGQTAFLCVLMAAFDMLKQDGVLSVSLTPMQSFAWLTTAGTLGVLLAVPMRRHFIVDEQLTYPDGVAAAETLILLDSKGDEARAASQAMIAGTGASGLLMLAREDARLVPASLWHFPETFVFGPTGPTMGFGVGASLLSLGSGMLVGMRVNASMLAGTLASWLFLPPLLVERGVVPGVVRKSVLLWIMWPATGMLVAGGLAALLLRWRILVKTFRQLSGAAIGGDEFPMRWVATGVALCTVALAVVQAWIGTPLWETALAILCAIPLMLVGLRVLGETNWGPISAMSNMMQAVFAVASPGNIASNMVASGVAGSVAAQSEGLMQDYKTGFMIGSSPRYLTYAQLMAVPVGAAAVSLAYPMLRDEYGIGGDTGLQSPISAKWSGFARLLASGFDALPRGAFAALVVGSLLGVALTLLEGTRYKKWTPSPTGIGIGMLVPASAIVTMFLGGVVEWTWSRLSPASSARFVVPLASGMIAGEALVATMLPVLFHLGVPMAG